MAFHYHNLSLLYDTPLRQDCNLCEPLFHALKLTVYNMKAKTGLKM